MSPDNAERINDLTLKYLDSTLSESEAAELELFLAGDESNRAAFLKRTDPEWIEKSFGIYLKAEARQRGLYHQLVFKRRPKRWALLAAAVILLVIATGVMVWLHPFRKNTSIQQIANTPPRDLLPGGTKATLTLSGGQQIILDNEKNGAIAQQGNSKVIKKSDGTISYAANSLHEKPQKEIVYNTLTIPRSGRYVIVLPDNTKVYLNSASTLKYPISFAGLKDRTVELSGEAFFEVAREADKPFKVRLGDRLIEVLGTEFNVQDYADEPSMQTTLISGAVKVSNGSDQVVLKPGQQAAIDGQRVGSSISVSRVDNIEKLISWKNGYFFFQNDDIATIMRRLSRWYDVTVEYEGKVTKDKFSGTVKMDGKASELLNLLEIGGVHYRLEDKKIVVLP